MHGNGVESRHGEGFSASPVTQTVVKRLTGTGAVEPRVRQPLSDQPGFEIMHQRLSGASPKPFRLYIAERDLAADRSHGDADRFVLQQGDVQVQPRVGQPGLHVFNGFIVGPGGDGARIVAMVQRAADANGALDDAADDPGVGSRCLADVYKRQVARSTIATIRSLSRPGPTTRPSNTCNPGSSTSGCT